MSFFEPIPPPPEPPAPAPWAPPLWDRPSEGTMPAVVPVNAEIFRGPRAAVDLSHLSVYPNGFTINLHILTDPRGDGMDLRRDRAYQFPRVGVRFADGRTGRCGDTAVNPYELPKDERGLPTDPWVQWTGGGGGQHGMHFGIWVFPLPPDGPLEVFVSLARVADHETRIEVDGAAVRQAAERATVIWE